MPKKKEGRGAASAAKPRSRCFLCRNPILAEEQEDAYERLLSDAKPSRVDYAHGECAEKEGLWEERDEEEERPRGR